MLFDSGGSCISYLFSVFPREKWGASEGFPDASGDVIPRFGPSLTARSSGICQNGLHLKTG